MSEQLEDFAAGAGPVPRVTRPISRRAVGIGAVWSVPVILTAVAAPAAAASVTPKGTPAVGGKVTADKVAAQQFGTKHVDFTLTLTNTGTAAGTTQVLSLVSDGIQGTVQGVPTTVVVAAGGSVTVHFSY